jgi:hypothetical protein
MLIGWCTYRAAEYGRIPLGEHMAQSAVERIDEIAAPAWICWRSARPTCRPRWAA